MQIKNQLKFPTKKFSHPTERNPALIFNLVTHSNIGQPRQKIMPAHKKAKSTSEKPNEIDVEITQISFPYFYS
jgi:hypothetical protein